MLPQAAQTGPWAGTSTVPGYRGRLAPSPTGYLHLGHARTFLIAAERAAGGVLALRIDDLDTQRARAEFERAAVEDLSWLGIRWQEGPQPDGAEPGGAGPYRQSRRMGLYQAAFERLRAAGAAYPCTCSRRDLQRAASAPHGDEEDEPVYPGTCRSRSVQDLPGQSAWRFRVPDGAMVRFHDEHLGPQAFTAGVDFGDFVLLRRDGVPSYQLATVVDDAAMGMTEVVRGRDLLKSTARQILLQRALGYAEPAWFHCDLMVDDTGVRLAKRHDALSIRALRQQGLTADAVKAMALKG